jgi:nucleoid-associated protein YgaU
MIALRELGDSNRYKDIMRWNNITDASTVPVGLQLQIKLEQPQLSDPMVSAATTEQSYVVQPGDFLGKISQKFYGTSKNVDMILKANNLKNANSIRVGQLLIIPAK